MFDGNKFCGAGGEFGDGISIGRDALAQGGREGSISLIKGTRLIPEGGCILEMTVELRNGEKLDCLIGKFGHDLITEVG